MPGNRAPERAEGVGGEGRKVQPGRASPAPHPPSGTQLASFYVSCWRDSRGWGGPLVVTSLPHLPPGQKF